RHILDGDPGAPGSGHGPNRGSVRGAFPDTWTDDQVISAVERVANSPTSTWKQTTGPGFDTAPVTRGGPAQGFPTHNRVGNPVRFEVQGRDHSLDISVFVEPGPGGVGVVTAYVRGR
ncbi:MAG: EndoU domain-containing protein, partial [Myxococcales bacterium]|nr:EndoU domain-containing protein [Myxococcales bacterium]